MKRTKGIGGLATRVLDHSLRYREKAEVYRLRTIMWSDQRKFAKGWGQLALCVFPLAYALAVMFLALGLILATMMYDLAASLGATIEGRSVEDVGRAGEEDGGEAESGPQPSDL